MTFFYSYKGYQINGTPPDSAFWGVPAHSRLVAVLKPSSLAGNNIMGEILMEYVSKIATS